MVWCIITLLNNHQEQSQSAQNVISDTSCAEETTIEPENLDLENVSKISIHDYVFDGTRIKNAKDDKTLYKQATWTNDWGMSLTVDESRKRVNVVGDWDKLSPHFDSVPALKNKTGTETWYINGFSQPIYDIFIGGAGQSGGVGTILYIMEDGTLEYTPMYTAIKNGDFRSFGRFGDYKNIIKFYDTSCFYVMGQNDDGTSYGQGWATVTAQDINGDLYDLFDTFYEVQP